MSLALSPSAEFIAESDKWRRGRDSNPRSPARGTTLFETAPFDRSGTSPSERGQGLTTSSQRTSSERKDRSVRCRGSRRQRQADREVAVRRAPGDKAIVTLGCLRAGAREAVISGDARRPDLRRREVAAGVDAGVPAL